MAPENRAPTLGIFFDSAAGILPSVFALHLRTASVESGFGSYYSNFSVEVTHFWKVIKNDDGHQI